MPYRLRISEDEVREELVRMGYRNFTDEMVASFRKDLLKMIKSDLRKLKEERRAQSESDAGSSEIDLMSSSRRPQYPDRSNELPHTSTPLSPAAKSTSHKTPRRAQSDDDGETESGYSDRESEASISTYGSHGERDKTSDFGSLSDVASKVDPTLRIPADSNQISKPLRSSKTINGKVPPFSHERGAASSLVNHEVPNEGEASSHPPLLKSSISGREKRSQGCLPKKPEGKTKKSLPDYPSRNDPVSLYHFYRAHWDKYKVPGEDPRSKLRWDIRTKLFYST